MGNTGWRSPTMIEIGKRTLLIGERINPTGRQRLASQLEAGKLELVIEEARAQAAEGAYAIDVNVGALGVDEVELLPRAALVVGEATGLPVCVDSSDPAALAAALEVLSGDAIVNSVTGDADFQEVLLPAVAESGAVLIAITKDRSGIPGTAEERMEMAARIIESASSHGIDRSRILVDFLTIPVSTEVEAANVTLECVRRAAAELGVGTVLGASNISFGMPERGIINASFLSMAVMSGLSAALINPGDAEVAQAVRAADTLVARDPLGRAFLKDFRRRRKEAGPS